MVMRLLPQVQQEPQRSPAGQAQGAVVPMQDATGSQIADIGEGVARLGQSVTASADLYQDQLDLAIQAQSENRLRDVMRQELEAPESGYLNTVGMESVGDRRKKAFDRMTAERTKIESSLTNEAQKAGFREQADRMLSTATLLADRHQQDQVKVFRVGELRARASNSMDEAAKTGDEAAKLSALRDIDDYADLLGWGDEQRSALKLQETTKLHETVLRGIIDTKASGAPAAAAAYLEANKGEISAPALRQINGALRVATTADESARLTAAVYEQANKDVYGERAAMDESPLTPAEQARGWARASEIVQQQYANGSISIELRDASLDRIDADHRRQRSHQSEVTNANLDMATQWLAQNPMASLPQLQEAMPDVYAAVSAGGGESQLREFARNGRYVTDDGVFAAALGKSDAYWRGLSEPEVIQQYRKHLDNGDLRTILSRRRQAIGDLDKNATLALSTEQRIMDGFFKARGIENTGETLSPGNKKLLGIYRQNLQKRIDAEGAEVKPGEDLQRVIDSALLDTARTTVGWGDPERPVVSMTKEEQDNAFLTVGNEQIDLSKIETKVRETIMRNLRAAGDQATEREVLVEWLKLGRPKTVADIRE